MSENKAAGTSGTIVAKESSSGGIEGIDIDNKQRRLLVGGSITGVAAAVWHKPLINAVALPAHAQTSTPPAAPTAMTFFGAGDVTPKSVSSSILDALIPEAHAGDSAEAESVMASIVQNEIDGTEYTVSLLVDLGDNLSRQFEKVQLLFSGSLTLGVQGELAITEDPCDLENELFERPVPPLNVTLESVTEELAVITGGNSFIEEGTVSIPAGTGSLPSAMCMEVQRARAFALFNFESSQDAQRSPEGGFESIAKSVLNTIVPEVSAGQVARADTFSAAALLIDEDDGDTYTVTVQNEDRGIRWSGSIFVEDGGSERTVLSLDRRVTCNETSSDDNEILATLSEGGGLPVMPVAIGPSMGIGLQVPELGIFVTLAADTRPLGDPEFCID